MRGGSPRSARTRTSWGRDADPELPAIHDRRCRFARSSWARTRIGVPGVWIPIAHFRKRYTGWDAQAQNRDIPLTTVLGRLRDGASPTSAQAGDRRARGRSGGEPTPEPSSRVAYPCSQQVWIDPSARADESATIQMMTIAAIGFLLLVCANVANVLLSIASDGGEGERHSSRDRSLAQGESPPKAWLGTSCFRYWRGVRRWGSRSRWSESAR